MLSFVARLLTAFIVLVVAGAGTINTKVGMTGDMYVFAQSWQPEFCYGKVDYAGCAAPKDYWTKYFTIHGLWPQYTTGGFPANCNTEPFSSSTPEAVGYNDMVTYWPDVQYAEGDPNYNTFWDHEWSKHGTCTALAQTDYFSTTINLHKSFGTPSLITDNVGGTVDAATLRNFYGGPTMVALQCSAGVYINGVYTCWSAVDGKPSARVTCPSDVQAEDTCTGSTLYVATFGANPKLLPTPKLRGSR